MKLKTTTGTFFGFPSSFHATGGSDGTLFDTTAVSTVPYLPTENISNIGVQKQKLVIVSANVAEKHRVFVLFFQNLCVDIFHRHL